jgi:branched-chain amino acid transport system ATP-binding protein
MEALRVEGVSINFGGVEILKDVSFSVKVGERMAVIGPNGAGKTTLLNVLAGELAPTAGRIYLLERKVTAMPMHRRVHLGLARSFQIVNLFFDLTVLANMLLALQGTKPSRLEIFRSFMGYDETLDEAQRLLETMDLWETRDVPVQTLSYADQRKLEIALSVASKPKVLLLDEPSAGLAIAEIPLFVNMIKSLAKDTTVFFAAHDMDVVFELADHVKVLYYGQIIAEGTPEEIQRDARVKEVYLGVEKGVASAEVG